MNSCLRTVILYKFPIGILHKMKIKRSLLPKFITKTVYSSSHFSTYERKEINQRDNNRQFVDHSFKSINEEWKIKNKNSLYYLSALTILVGGFTYLSVLLYRLYCQSTGSGQAVLDEAGEKIAEMKPVKTRTITVNFNADLNSSIMWNFKPQQPYIKVAPGETALAFYTAMNPSDKPVTGVATYNVLPFEAGKYFNKIQCFCFEEQQLNPHEEVDMPVFFYLDPEYAEDPFLENKNDITLSYTFFEAKEGIKLPRPSFL